MTHRGRGVGWHLKEVTPLCDAGAVSWEGKRMEHVKARELAPEV
jgi:hypothetical protein